MMPQPDADSAETVVKAPPTWAVRASMAVAVILGVLIFVTLGAFGFMLVRKMMGKDDLPALASNSAKPARSAKTAGRVIREPWPEGAKIAAIMPGEKQMVVRLDLGNDRSALWIISLEDGRVIAEYGDHVPPEPAPKSSKKPPKAE